MHLQQKSAQKWTSHWNWGPHWISGCCVPTRAFPLTLNTISIRSQFGDIFGAKGGFCVRVELEKKIELRPTAEFLGSASCVLAGSLPLQSLPNQPKVPRWRYFGDKMWILVALRLNFSPGDGWMRGGGFPWTQSWIRSLWCVGAVKTRTTSPICSPCEFLREFNSERIHVGRIIQCSEQKSVEIEQ